jgi:hypothetical protein
MKWYTIYDHRGYIVIRTTDRKLAEKAKKDGRI